MIPGDLIYDPDRQKADHMMSLCFDYTNEVSKRGNGYHTYDANVLAQLVTNLYIVLPKKNTNPREIGERFEADWYRFKKKVNDLGDDTMLERDEYAFRVWAECLLFIERCSEFMFDVFSVKNVRQKKPITEGAGYDQRS